MRHRHSAFLLLLLLSAAWLGRSLRVDAMDRHLSSASYEDVYYVPEARWLPVVSLGYDEALADLLWSKALIYYGDELQHRGGARHALRYANAVLMLDPWFNRAYRWAGMAGMYGAQDPTVEDIQASIAFLERGVRQFPDDGDMAWDLGASLAYELAPLLDDPEERRRASLRGVEFMQSAARLGAGPPWLALSNASQLQRLGQTQQAIHHLEEMYAAVSDPEIRESIGARLTQLRSEAHAEAFRRAHEELEEMRLREYPWMPAQLYIHLWEPQPIDPDAPLRGDWTAPELRLGDEHVPPGP